MKALALAMQLLALHAAGCPCDPEVYVDGDTVRFTHEPSCSFLLAARAKLN